MARLHLFKLLLLCLLATAALVAVWSGASRDIIRATWDGRR
jgi:hypothetical protein